MSGSRGAVSGGPGACGAIDSHAHLELGTYGEELPLVLERGWSAGLSGLVVVAAAEEPGLYGETALLAESDPRVRAMAGIHPHVARLAEALWDALVRVLSRERFVAVGEFGLDFHYMHSPKSTQIEVMKRQLELAAGLDMPVVLHVREAFEESLEVLDGFGGPHRGIVHCFTGTVAEAEEYLARGLHLSIPGVVTFGRKAEALAATVRSLPLDRLLLETDSPYLAPHPFRGRRNEPSFLAHTLHEVALIRGVPPRELAAATATNTCRALGVSFPPHQV